MSEGKDTRARLTPERIRKLECPDDKTQAFLWDTAMPGLGVRCTPAGTKSFVFQARLKDRRTIRKTIGSVDAWTTEAARKRAGELRVEVDSDKDPRLESAKKRRDLQRAAAEAQRDKITAQSAWDAYIAERTPDWAPLTLRNHLLQASPGGVLRKHPKNRKTKPGPLASLLLLRLAEIDAARVAVWLKREKLKRPSAAWLAFVMLRGFLNWASEQESYRGAAAATACRALAVRTLVPRVRAKSDCLQREQLAAWFSAVRTLEPTTAAYLQSLLLLGARRSELATLTWDQVDLQWQTITIGGKTGARLIPLPPYCRSLIAALPRVNDNPYVFASTKGSASGHIIDPMRAHTSAQARAGITGLTLHGLRRSFATLAEWSDPPSGVIAQIQGHAPSAVAERHYKRRSVDFLRQWHEKIEAWFLDESGVVLVPAAKDGTKLRAVKGGRT
jgi:integrase